MKAKVFSRWEKCDGCGGTGKMTLDVIELGTKSKSVIKCVDCDGKGKLPVGTNERKRKASEEFWCSCKEEYGTTFYDDDERSRVCKKHHYRCNNCGKVVQ